MGWYNANIGVGTSTNSIEATTYALRSPFDRQLLEAIYRQNGVARKIIARMPFDATREGWDRYKGIDEELSKALAKEERRLRLGRLITDALIYERLYGGAAVVMDVDDGQPSWMPLEVERVRAVRSMFTAHRWELWPHTYIRGGWLPSDGEPEVFNVQRDSGGAPMLVHRSRMLLFAGDTLPGQARDGNWGWGDPVMEYVWNELRNAGVSDAGVIDYLLQLSVPLVKISGWWKLISGKGGEAAADDMLTTLRKRLSMFRLMAMDSSDGMERLQASVAGISDLLAHQKAQTSAVTNYPQTILFGTSPEGMNATGKSDLELYYGWVRAAGQEDRLREPLELWYRIVALAPVWGGDSITNPLPLDVRQADPGIEFRPLWLPTSKELADEGQIKANTRAVYVNLGVMDSDECRTLLEADGMIEPPSEEDLEDVEEEAPDPLAPPRAVSAAVSAGIRAARGAGFEPPPWERSVAQALANGRRISTSQALQLEGFLREDPATDADDKLRAYFGGPVTLAWLASLAGGETEAAEAGPSTPTASLGDARADAEELISWRGRTLRIEVRAGETREFPGTAWPPVSMPCDYGSIVGTPGLDGEDVDVLLLRDPLGAWVDGPVHAGLIRNPATGDVDEVKMVLGAPDVHAAGAMLVICYGGMLDPEIVAIDDEFMAFLLSRRV